MKFFLTFITFFQEGTFQDLILNKWGVVIMQLIAPLKGQSPPCVICNLHGNTIHKLLWKVWSKLILWNLILFILKLAIIQFKSWSHFWSLSSLLCMKINRLTVNSFSIKWPLVNHSRPFWFCYMALVNFSIYYRIITNGNSLFLSLCHENYFPVCPRICDTSLIWSTVR